MQHRISAGAIVLHDDRLLMVKHTKPGVYDFWVCPGGGVQGTESLEATAAREVEEETGLRIEVGSLAYIEEFFNHQTRYVKFWFLGTLVGGSIDTSHPDTVREHIVAAAWRTRDQIRVGTVFPTFLQTHFFNDTNVGLTQPVRIPLKEMLFW